jgi:hypothetical protein
MTWTKFIYPIIKAYRNECRWDCQLPAVGCRYCTSILYTVPYTDTALYLNTVSQLSGTHVLWYSLGGGTQNENDADK